MGQYLSTDRKGGVLFLRFRHKIAADAYSTPAITEDLEMAAELAKGKSIVLDLANLDYASSAFLGTLLAWHQKAAASGAHVRLCSVNPRLMEIFRIVNLDKAFPIDDSAEAAFQTLNGGKA
ncbi:MAG: STAS domain-containing protein [Planctomycetota bacterium]